MKNLFKQAHELTKNTIERYGKSDYKATFILFIKFLANQNKKTNEVKFDINQNIETQQIFVDYITDIINAELEKNDRTDWIYSNRKTTYRYWQGGNNQRFYIKSFFNYKSYKTANMKTDETDIGFMFIDTDGKLQYGDGLNTIDNEFRNLIEQNFDKLVEKTKQRYKNLSETKPKKVKTFDPIATGFVRGLKAFL